MNHPPAGPREERAAIRAAFLEQWCQRNIPEAFDRFPREVVIGLASEVGHAGKLTPEHVRERLGRW